jgi:hypothetical protein
MDFPPPVGIMASVSFLLSTDRIISSCCGRKEAYPQWVCNMERIDVTMEQRKSKYQPKRLFEEIAKRKTVVLLLHGSGCPAGKR